VDSGGSLQSRLENAASDEPAPLSDLIAHYLIG
jgi:hypothetical protein